MSVWLRSVRRWNVREQHRALVRKLLGHYAYYAVSDNWRRLGSYWKETRRLWFKWLNRRSQRHRHTWEWFKLLMKRYPFPRGRLVFSLYT